MRAKRSSEDTVTPLVEAARKTLWRRRFLQTGNTVWSVLAMALVGLTLVHRTIATLPGGLTLLLAVLAIVATAGWQVRATRPSLDDSLREADQLAGTDMLMASAWSVRRADPGSAGWGTLEVQRTARRTASKTLATLNRDRSALQRPSYTAALLVVAASLLVLAQPRGQEVVTTVPLAASPEAGDSRDAHRNPVSDSDATPDQPSDTSSPAPQEAPETRETLADTEARRGAPLPADAEPRAMPGAVPGDTPGGELPSTLPAADGSGIADTATTPDRVEFVDIRRRGARTAGAQPGAGNANADSDVADGTGDPAPWSGLTDIAPPPLEADPVTRHYLSRWQQRRETQR
ncbi:MAG: hypothetical protein AAFN78_08430 [Pseudomonadota bacterium]